MKSSYNENINYGDLLAGIVYTINPKYIVEIGILEGFSLKTFIDNSSPETKIEAYDIFDEFNGNGANKSLLLKDFSQYDNVNINYGDFYKKYNDIPDNSVDIIHIDIANTGEIYDLAINNYITKLTDKGILILEGGSEERDNVEWMNKYNKSKIQPIIKKYENNFRIKNIGIFPSLTIITKN